MSGLNISYFAIDNNGKIEFYYSYFNSVEKSGFQHSALSSIIGAVSLASLAVNIFLAGVILSHKRLQMVTNLFALNMALSLGP